MTERNKKLVSKVMAVCLAAMPLPVMAEEAVTEVVTEAVQEAVTEETQAQPEKIAVQLSQDTEVTLLDETGMVQSVEVTEKSEHDANDVKCVKAAVKTKDGGEHVFEDFPVEMTDPAVILEDGFFLVRYQNKDGETKLAYETAPEKTFDEPEERYVIETVNVRAKADGDSDVIGNLARGSQITVVGATPNWCHIKDETTEGYVARRFTTTSKEEAENAVEAYSDASAKTSDSYEYDYSYEDYGYDYGSDYGYDYGYEYTMPAGRYEVSRENFPDCDGSGHGYYLITYSDGTTETVDY